MCTLNILPQVLEQRKQHSEAARAHFTAAQTLGPHLFEPYFNGGEAYMPYVQLSETILDAQCRESCLGP